MIPPNKWLWFGEPGHLIVSRRCVHHLHTHIGHYCISTIGDFRPDQDSNEVDTIGAGELDYYETMVFSLLPDAERFEEVHCTRYATCILADAGHMGVCHSFAKVAKGATLLGDCLCKETIEDAQHG